MAQRRMVSRTLGCSRRFNAAADLIEPALLEFAQLLFVMLIPHADDFGRMAGDAYTIKLTVLPASRRTVEEFAIGLQALHQAELIELYTVDGNVWLHVNKFDAHQQGLHKRTRSNIPDPPGYSGNLPERPTDSNDRREIPSELNRTEQKGTEEKRTEPLSDDDTLFERFWTAYPKKTAKPVALTAWRTIQATSVQTDAIVAAVKQKVTSPEWTRDNGRFIPNPAKWLSERRWEDRPTVVKAPSATTAEGVRQQTREANCSHVADGRLQGILERADPEQFGRPQ